MEKTQIKHRTIRSIVALVSRSVLLQIISFVAFFFLGIFLNPSALGLFIVVSAIMRIFTIFTDIGLGAALVQKDNLEKDDLETAFTLQIILISLVVGVGFAITSLVKSYLQLPAAGVDLYHVLLITLFISSLKTIPSILLERNLAFEKQVLPQIVESIVFNLIVVFLAYKGFEVISYSWAIIISALVGLPIYYIVSPWKIRLSLSKSSLRSLTSYGVLFQSKSILSIIKDDLLTLFLGGLVGSSGIGFWGWAQRWSYSPFRLVVDNITKVTFPTYSRVKNDPDALRNGIEKTIFAISMVLYPVLSLMAGLIPLVLELIPKYTKWIPALPSFYLLCLAAALSGVSNVLINVLDATGKVKTTLGLMIMWIVMTWILTPILTIRLGFTGISLAAFLVSCSIVITVMLTKKVVNFSLMKILLPSIFSSAISFIVLKFVSSLLPASFISLIILGVVSCSVYITLMYLFSFKRIKEFAIEIRSAYVK